jgi:transcriptional regulator with XRE-family HTH domain
MPTKEQLADLLQNPDFRREFVSDFAQEMIATQIRAMRERLGLNQGQLGDAAGGMSQIQVSRLENPDYSGTSVNSLKRIAQAFEVGLIVRFAPFSQFIDWIVSQTPDKLVPLSYAEE